MRIIDFVDGFESAVEPGTSIPDASHMEVTPVGNLSSNNGQAAFEELQGDIDTLNAMLGQPNGIATLNASGKLLDSVIPALAITNTYTVADIAARDALTVEAGDVAVVADAGGSVTKTYSYSGSVWIELITNGALAAHMSNTSNPHNVTKSQVGLGNVDNTSDATKNSAAATLTNKTFGDAPTFTQISTPSNPASGFNKLYPKSDGKFYVLKSDGTETAVGSGSGGGDFNLIADGDAEGQNIILLTKNTSAAARPDNGFVTSSVSITTSITSSAPLNGLKSWLLTKPASNCQGQQFVIPFTMPKRFRAKVMDINIPYIVNSGTFVAGTNTTDSDAIVYIAYQDPADSIWKFIEPSSMKFLSNSTTICDDIRSTFQTHAFAINYKLLIHVASTSTNAWELEVDDFKVSPSKYVYGTPITDWRTDSGSGSWTNTTYSYLWRRVGDTMEIQGYIVATGTPSGGTLYANTPSNYSIDYSKYPAGLGGGAKVGILYAEDAGITGYDGFVFNDTQTRFGFSYEVAPANASPVPVTSAAIANTAPFTFGTGDFVKFKVAVPIVGWSSSVQMSDSTSTREVCALFTKNGTQAIVTNAKITNLTPVIDTLGAWDATNNRYVIFVPGFYQVSQQHAYSANTSGGITAFKINGGTTYYCGTTASTDRIGGTTQIPVPLKVGDYIEFYANPNNSVTLNAGTTDTWFAISKSSGSAVIAASESVIARYTSTAGQSIAATTTTIVDFGTKTKDTHGRVTTGASWKFVAESPGYYELDAKVKFPSMAQNKLGILTVFVNGSVYETLQELIQTYPGTDRLMLSGSSGMQLVTGDFVDVRVWHNDSVSRALETTASYNTIKIKRSGNY